MRVVETKRFSKALKKLLANGLDGRLVAPRIEDVLWAQSAPS